MKRRMAYELLTNPQLQSQVAALPQVAFSNVLREITLIERAESELGVTLSEEEERQRLTIRLGVSEDAGGQAFAEALRDALDESRLNETEYRRFIRASGIEEKVRAKFTAEAPATDEQAKLEVIAAGSQEEALQAIVRIGSGEEWASVAKALSREGDVQTTGGVKDFNNRDSIDLTYQNYAFTAPIGEISNPPLEGNGLFYVVRVVERKDAELTEPQKSNYAGRRFREWLEATQLKMNIKRDWEDDAQADALTSVIDDVGDEVIRQRQEREQAAQTPITVPDVQPTAAPDGQPTTGPEAQPPVEPSAPEPQPTAAAP
jgi:hypothetical protein